MKLRRPFLWAGIFLLMVVPLFYLFVSRWYVVPIMMYHKVENTSEISADTVSPEFFEKHMSFLKRNGYHVLRLSELVEAKRKGRALPFKSVVITFDDGYLNNFTRAYPVLKKYQIPATIFISPDYLSGETGYMNWPQARQMQEEGLIDFGSHGLTQAYLPPLSEQRLREEIIGSKMILEEGLGVPVDYFAYPVGGFNYDIKTLLARSRYKGGLATNRGDDRFDKDVFELNRIRFSDKDNSEVILRVKLSGFYNLFRAMKKPE